MRLTLTALLLIAASTAPAFAYVGPGAGISLIGSVIGLFAVIGTALTVIIMAPIRAARKKAVAKAAAKSDISQA